jgi:hypothetical protein
VDKVGFIGDSYGGPARLRLRGRAPGARPHSHPVGLRRTRLFQAPSAPGRDFSPFHRANKEQVDKLHGQANSDAETADLDLRAHFRIIFYSQELCDRYLANAPDLGSASATGEAVSKAVANLDLTPQMAHFHSRRL